VKSVVPIFWLRPQATLGTGILFLQEIELSIMYSRMEKLPIKAILRNYALGKLHLDKKKQGFFQIIT
jgi:hypothetical protein